jgi:hypothetical protein
VIDADGAEVPYLIPLEGVPNRSDAFEGGRSHLVDVDELTATAYFAVESRESLIACA